MKTKIIKVRGGHMWSLPGATKRIINRKTRMMGARGYRLLECKQAGWTRAWTLVFVKDGVPS